MSKRDSHLPENRLIFCNKCGSETHHTCKFEHSQSIIDEDGFYSRYRFWTCAGCEDGTLEEIYLYVSRDPEYGYIGEAEELDSHYHPQRTKLLIRGKTFIQLPKILEHLYREVLLAFNNDEPILCAIGIRALLEGICAEKGIGGKNLEAKIDGMSSILNPNIITGLHGIRFLGNAAAHELTPPESADLRLAIEICEDLLNFLYELDYKARGIALNQATNKLFRSKTTE